jgi:tRNA U54 and U55 pseudouridine synthase Pus10
VGQPKACGLKGLQHFIRKGGKARIESAAQTTNEERTMKAKSADRMKKYATKEYEQGQMTYSELQTLAFELNEAVRKTPPKDR